MKKQKTPKRRGRACVQKDDRLFSLEVRIISGPVDEKFLKKNPVICRTIQLRGDHLLSELHEAIFRAFDREDPHMYQFEIGGKELMDPDARRYVLSMAMEDIFDDEPPAGAVDTTTLGSLGLKKDDIFVYWFDFGDNWWHQISVREIATQAGTGKYPKVIARLGESPPQYLDCDDENQE